MAMPAQRAPHRRWTEEEFYTAREAAPPGERWELVDGEVLVTPAPHWMHQRIIEIISPSSARFDRVKKRPHYQRNRVPWSTSRRSSRTSRLQTSSQARGVQRLPALLDSGGSAAYNQALDSARSLLCPASARSHSQRSRSSPPPPRRRSPRKSAPTRSSPSRNTSTSSRSASRASRRTARRSSTVAAPSTSSRTSS